MNLLQRFRSANRTEQGLPRILVIDFACFFTLVVAYLLARHGTPVWPRPFHFPSGLMTVSMALFAVAASFVMHVAVKTDARQEPAMTQRMIALALVGWVTFLFLLAMEWARLLFIEHVTLLSNPWNVSALGVVYYGFTAFAAAHVVAGLFWLASAAHKPNRWRISTLTLFVDFTNALFLVIAFLVILSSTDLSGF